MQKLHELEESMMSFVKDILNFISEYYEGLGFIALVVGGIFALAQWNMQIKHKQAEIVQELICKVRDDEDISVIMDIIDWNEGIQYDGKFRVNDQVCKSGLADVSDDDLFKMIDKTLSHFSYICYLKERKILKEKEIKPFEYALRRLIDNPHIRNYLYSLYHWSKTLGVSCSFCYFIDYCVNKEYLSSDFMHYPSDNYKCFLVIPVEAG